MAAVETREHEGRIGAARNCDRCPSAPLCCSSVCSSGTKCARAWYGTWRWERQGDGVICPPGGTQEMTRPRGRPGPAFVLGRRPGLAPLLDQEGPQGACSPCEIQTNNGRRGGDNLTVASAASGASPLHAGLGFAAWGWPWLAETLTGPALVLAPGRSGARLEATRRCGPWWLPVSVPLRTESLRERQEFEARANSRIRLGSRSLSNAGRQTPAVDGRSRNP
jgi:hypothetical protein